MRYSALLHTLTMKVEGLFGEVRGSQASHTELFIAAFTRKFTANTLKKQKQHFAVTNVRRAFLSVIKKCRNSVTAESHFLKFMSVTLLTL